MKAKHFFIALGQGLKASLKAVLEPGLGFDQSLHLAGLRLAEAGAAIPQPAVVAVTHNYAQWAKIDQAEALKRILTICQELPLVFDDLHQIHKMPMDMIHSWAEEATRIQAARRLADQHPSAKMVPK